jgi:hypothetical protein
MKQKTIRVAVDLSLEPYAILNKYAYSKESTVSDIVKHVAYLIALRIKEGKPLEMFDEIKKEIHQ